MTQRQVEDYLQDILEAVAAIEEFSAGIDFESLAQIERKSLPSRGPLRLLVKR